MPGYCVAGTVGWKILNGQKKIEFENRQVVSVVNLNVNSLVDTQVVDS